MTARQVMLSAGCHGQWYSGQCIEIKRYFTNQRLSDLNSGIVKLGRNNYAAPD